MATAILSVMASGLSIAGFGVYQERVDNNRKEIDNIREELKELREIKVDVKAIKLHLIGDKQ